MGSQGCGDPADDKGHSQFSGLSDQRTLMVQVQSSRWRAGQQRAGGVWLRRAQTWIDATGGGGEGVRSLLIATYDEADGEL